MILLNYSELPERKLVVKRLMCKEVTRLSISSFSTNDTSAVPALSQPLLTPSSERRCERGGGEEGSTSLIKREGGPVLTQ